MLGGNSGKTEEEGAWGSRWHVSKTTGVTGGGMAVTGEHEDSLGVQAALVSLRNCRQINQGSRLPHRSQAAR